MTDPRSLSLPPSPKQKKQEEEKAAQQQPPPKSPLVLDVGMGVVDHAEAVPGTSRVEWRTKMSQTVLPRLAKCVVDVGCC